MAHNFKNKEYNVNQVFVRSEHLAEKIYDVKLFMTDWKVLFALDGKMNTEEISHFLEMDPGKTEQSIKQLLDLQLILPLGAEKASPAVAKTVQQEFEVAEKPEPEAEVTEEPEVEEETQEMPIEEVEQIEEEKKKVEAEEEPEKLEETELEEEKQEAESPEEEFETADSTLDEGYEELKVGDEEEDQKEKEEESEQDLDQLINDLLQEEGTLEESEEGQSTEEELEETEQKAIDEPEAESDTEKTPEGAEKGDFDLGNIFDTDITETEESIDEMLKTEDTEEAVTEEEAEVKKPPVTIPDSDKKTILVVDDSVVIRKMVEIALENENYNIITVANGKDAFTFLDEQNPDLVILDIMLPDVNGLDILKTIKASKEIPVVMLSAKDTPKETNKAKELGANDFIPKPFRDEDLIKKIHGLIGE
jgi:CheY-like chemotaxis protein